MPTVHSTVRDCTDYWQQIVVPDFDDCQDQPGDLRKAFHCAISLFHMCDWVFVSYRAQVCSSFTYDDQHGARQPVTSEQTFANALRTICGDFELIRGIANSAKHLQLRSVGGHPNAPIHAANTRVQSTGFGSGGFGVGPFGGSPRVMLEVSNGGLEFSGIAANVRDMWLQLATQYGWPMA